MLGLLYDIHDDHRSSAEAVRERLGDAGEAPARRIERASADAS